MIDFQADLPADWYGRWDSPDFPGLDPYDDPEAYSELSDARSGAHEASGEVAPGTRQIGGTVYCWDEQDTARGVDLHLTKTTVMMGDTAHFTDCVFEDVLFLSPAGSGNGMHFISLFERCSFTGTVRFAMEDVDGEPYHFFTDCDFKNAEIQVSSGGFDFAYPRDELPFVSDGLEEMPDDADVSFTDCTFEVVSTRGVAKSQVLNPVTWVHHY